MLRTHVKVGHGGACLLQTETDAIVPSSLLAQSSVPVLVRDSVSKKQSRWHLKNETLGSCDACSWLTT